MKVSKLKVGQLIPYFIILFASILILIPYWITFGLSPSSSQNDWEFFVLYFNSIASPIFLIITIFITIRISQSASISNRTEKMIEDIKSTIKSQDEEIERQLNREIYWSEKSDFSTCLKSQFREILAINERPIAPIRVSVDAGANYIIPLEPYFNVIVHNLDNLKVLLCQYSEVVVESSTFVGFYKRKHSFLLEQLKSENTIAYKYISINQTNIAILRELYTYFSHAE